MYWERKTPSCSFIEIEREGTRLVRRWGRIDTEGRSRIEVFKTKQETLLAFDRQVRGIEGKGYVGGRHHPDLLSAIEHAPDDDSPYLVYGDWLLEQQDPRGMLIRLMADHKAGEVRSWLEDHAEQLNPRPWSLYSTLEWRLGFIRRLTFRANLGGNEPWLLRRMLMHPSARFTREIVLDGGRNITHWALPAWKEVLTRRRALVTSVALRNSPSLENLVSAIPGLVCDQPTR